MNEMFMGCKSLKSLDIKNLIISPKCTIKNMFYGISEQLWDEIKQQNNNLEYQSFEQAY